MPDLDQTRRLSKVLIKSPSGNRGNKASPCNERSGSELILPVVSFDHSDDWPVEGGLIMVRRLPGLSSALLALISITIPLRDLGAQANQNPQPNRGYQQTTQRFPTQPSQPANVNPQSQPASSTGIAPQGATQSPNNTQAIQAQLQQRQNDLQGYQADLTELKSQLAALQSQMADLRSQQTSLNARKPSASNQAAQASWSRDAAALQASIDRLQNRISAVQHQIALKSQQIARTKHQIAILNSQLPPSMRR